MYQYNLRYRDWNIAADFSNLLREVWIEDFPDTVMIWEGASTPNVIEFFEILDAAIDKYEVKRDPAVTTELTNFANEPDDIPF